MGDPLEGLYFLCDAPEFVAGVGRGDGFAVIEILTRLFRSVTVLRLLPA